MNKFVSSREIHKTWVEFIHNSVQFIPRGCYIQDRHTRNGLHPQYSCIICKVPVRSGGMEHGLWYLYQFYYNMILFACVFVVPDTSVGAVVGHRKWPDKVETDAGMISV